MHHRKKRKSFEKTAFILLLKNSPSTFRLRCYRTARIHFIVPSPFTTNPPQIRMLYASPADLVMYLTHRLGLYPLLS